MEVKEVQVSKCPKRNYNPSATRFLFVRPVSVHGLGVHHLKNCPTPFILVRLSHFRRLGAAPLVNPDGWDARQTCISGADDDALAASEWIHVTKPSLRDGFFYFGSPGILISGLIFVCLG
jgi:hypothetical protein